MRHWLIFENGEEHGGRARKLRLVEFHFSNKVQGPGLPHLQ